MGRLRRWAFWIGAVSLGAGAAALTVVTQMHAPPPSVITLDSAMLSACDAADADSAPVSVPHDWQDEGWPIGCGWYRFELPLSVAPDRLWGIYLPSLEMTPRVLVNGSVVGGVREAADPLPRYWNHPVYYTVPSGLLAPGANRIEIRIQARSDWGRLGTVHLGPETDLKPAYRFRQFVRVDLLSATMMLSMVVSLFVGAMMFVRREPVYGTFAGFAAAFSLQNLMNLTVDVPVPNRWWDCFGYLLYGAIVVMGTLFTFRFLGLGHHRYERYLVAAVAVGSVLLVAAAAMGDDAVNFLGSSIWLPGLILAAVYPIGHMARTLLDQRSFGVFALTACYVMTITLGFNDWLITAGVGYRHHGRMLQFATGPLLLTFGGILLGRFVLALRESDDLTRSLEQRIAEKSQEIDRAYQHTRSLEQRQARSDERERIMRDLHDGFGGDLIGSLARLRNGQTTNDDIAAMLEAALRDLRLMIDSMDDVHGDLGAALGIFRNRIQPLLDAHGIELNWGVGELPPMPDLGPERVLGLLRILQESVTNVVKHSGAAMVSVTTSADRIINGVHCAVVDVADDGNGLVETAQPGRGLKNMKRRARDCGLQLVVDSGSPGVRVTVGVPLRWIPAASAGAPGSADGPSARGTSAP